MAVTLDAAMRRSMGLWQQVLFLALAVGACKRAAPVPEPPPIAQPSAPPSAPPAQAAGALNRPPPPIALAVTPLPTTPYIPGPAVDPTNPDADWYICARRGARLRAACRGADQACFDEVDGKIVDCYRAVYAKRVDTVGNRLELLGPRFAFERKNAVAEKDGSESYRQEGDAKYLSPRRFAEGVCGKALADVPRGPCIKELLFGVEQLVWMGGFGAGP